jgi:hypothetical protein
VFLGRVNLPAKKHETMKDPTKAPPSSRRRQILGPVPDSAVSPRVPPGTRC